MQIERYFWWD